MISVDRLRVRTNLLREMLRACCLCPRACGANRASGEQGFCGINGEVILSHALPHHGEEPAISGTRGAGTLFFSSCNLKCIYCQNHQISHGVTGRPSDGEALADVMIALQEKGCHNIELVTPTPHLPGILEGLTLATQRGLHIPVVYNCGGYEDTGVLGQLEGIVDVYLPDFKYGNDERAMRFSGVGDYVHQALTALREMLRQAGEEPLLEDGIVTRGLIVRHLVLPGAVENSFDALRLLRKHIPLTVPLSLMSQYTPMPPVAAHPDLGRRLSREEYDAVVDLALDLGFETLYIQDVDERHMAPDFRLEAPFQWL
ncbi:MAG: radical SAM protein [Deltaproteobacteria bacterium]|nr:radical SAM protein [Deltaproteobacteria bacterium]